MLCIFSDKGATYEFRVQAINENGAGHRAVRTLDIPDGGKIRNRFYVLL